MLLNPIDTLEGVGGRTPEVDGVNENLDEDYLPEVDGEGLDVEEEPLIVDSNIDPEEIANLLNDGGKDNSS